MINDILATFWTSFREALSELIVVAVQGGFLAWGVFMGKLLATGFFKEQSRYKVAFISMPLAVLPAVLFAFWSFKIVNPGETRTEALYDAQLTFYYVLVPLWAGCIWGIFRHRVDRKFTENEVPTG